MKTSKTKYKKKFSTAGTIPLLQGQVSSGTTPGQMLAGEKLQSMNTTLPAKQGVQATQQGGNAMQGVANAIPYVSMFKQLGEGIDNAVAKKDEYGVRQGSDFAVGVGGFFNPRDATQSAVNDIFKEKKFDADTALNLAAPFLGIVKANKEKRAARDAMLMEQQFNTQTQEAQARDSARNAQDVLDKSIASTGVSTPSFASTQKTLTAKTGGNLNPSIYRTGGSKGRYDLIDFKGPLHEEGGIKLMKRGGDTIEVEGGEKMIGNTILSDSIKYTDNMIKFLNSQGIKIDPSAKGKTQAEYAKALDRKKLKVNDTFSKNTEQLMNQPGRGGNADLERASDILGKIFNPDAEGYDPANEQLGKQLLSNSKYDLGGRLNPSKVNRLDDKHNPFLYLQKPLQFANEFKKGGTIHIKEKNKGKFTETKKRTGKTTEELTHSKNPITRKRAIFAQNAKKWKHEEGGTLTFPEGGKTTTDYYHTNDKGIIDAGPYAGLTVSEAGEMNKSQRSDIAKAKKDAQAKYVEDYTRAGMNKAGHTVYEAAKLAGSFTPIGPLIGATDAAMAFYQGDTAGGVLAAGAEALPYGLKYLGKGAKALLKEYKAVNELIESANKPIKKIEKPIVEESQIVTNKSIEPTTTYKDIAKDIRKSKSGITYDPALYNKQLLNKAEEQGLAPYSLSGYKPFSETHVHGTTRHMIGGYGQGPKPTWSPIDYVKTNEELKHMPAHYQSLENYTPEEVNSIRQEFIDAGYMPDFKYGGTRRFDTNGNTGDPVKYETITNDPNFHYFKPGEDTTGWEPTEVIGGEQREGWNWYKKQNANNNVSTAVFNPDIGEAFKWAKANNTKEGSDFKWTNAEGKEYNLNYSFNDDIGKTNQTNINSYAGMPTLMPRIEPLQAKVQSSVKMDNTLSNMDLNIPKGLNGEKSQKRQPYNWLAGIAGLANTALSGIANLRDVKKRKVAAQEYRAKMEELNRVPFDIQMANLSNAAQESSQTSGNYLSNMLAGTSAIANAQSQAYQNILSRNVDRQNRASEINMDARTRADYYNVGEDARVDAIKREGLQHFMQDTAGNIGSVIKNLDAQNQEASRVATMNQMYPDHQVEYTRSRWGAPSYKLSEKNPYGDKQSTTNVDKSTLKNGSIMNNTPPWLDTTPNVDPFLNNYYDEVNKTLIGKYGGLLLKKNMKCGGTLKSKK
jgi:hypothetical protein